MGDSNLNRKTLRSEDTPVYVIAGAETAAGLLLVQQLLTYNVRLVLISRHAALQKTVQRLPTYSDAKEGLLSYYRMDPSRASWLKLIARSIGAEVHGIVSFADFEGGASLRRLSHHQLQLQLRRNLFAPAALIHAMLPLFGERPFIALVAAGTPPYASLGEAVTTEGLHGLMQSVQAELDKADVHFLKAESADNIVAELLKRMDMERAQG